jgi:hypothetical protein
MCGHDPQPKRRKRFVATTDSDHDGPIFPDLARDGGHMYIAIAPRLRLYGRYPRRLVNRVVRSAARSMRVWPLQRSRQPSEPDSNAVATMGPTPGISTSRRLCSQARTARLKRATAGMRLSSWFAMISSNSAVPLRLFAEMMPSLAICPRIAFDSICGRAPQACSSNNVRSDTPQSRHRQAGRAAKNSNTFARLTRLRTTTAPPTSTP